MYAAGRNEHSLVFLADYLWQECRAETVLSWKETEWIEKTLRGQCLVQGAMQSQDDIFRQCDGAKFIFVLDAMEFYWQWRVHPDSRWTLTLTTHISQYIQYTSNVAVLGYEGSNAYVQRQMDTLLRSTGA